LTAAADYPAAMARVERLLAGKQPGAPVNLGPFLHELTDEVLTSPGPADRTAVSHAHAGRNMISAAQARPVGLIVGELVANAIHYGHPAGVHGRVEVESWPGTAGSCSIEVRDDGVGLPEFFDPSVDGGDGLGTVRALAERLGARLRFNDAGIGLSVRLDVPAKPKPRVPPKAKP
jgi:two-component sensor histidine kinase